MNARESATSASLMWSSIARAGFSLDAAFHSDNFRDGVLLAVNLGGDADTTGAVFGHLAGSYYGVSAIPLECRRLIVRHNEIVALADRLLQLAG